MDGTTDRLRSILQWLKGTPEQREAAASSAVQPPLGLATSALKTGVAQDRARGDEMRALAEADPMAGFTPEQIDALTSVASQLSGGLRGPGVPKARMRAGDVPRLPGADVKTLKKYFEMGAKNPSNVEWYTEGQKAGEQLVGENEPLLRLFGAIFSQRKGPVPETNLAMKAYRTWIEDGIDGLWLMQGPSEHQRGELIRGALHWENNKAVPHLGEKSLTPGSMKRRDYFSARGPEDVSVIDTH